MLRPITAFVLFLVMASVLPARSDEPATSAYKVQSVEGWTVHVSRALLSVEQENTAKALDLLQQQLAEIVRVMPTGAVARLREVPLWISPEYSGIAPKAEYHPDAGWLRAHRRLPAMAKAIEFTNVRIFAKETSRMPNFVLHELAHAYHDRVLGFDEPAIIAAYRQAKADKLYDKVERWHGNGRPNTHERAYAMTDHKEYFAECTEAFFSRNDFFPFTRAELRKLDPRMETLLVSAWEVGAGSGDR